jgi:hypothetical protein
MNPRRIFKILGFSLFGPFSGFTETPFISCLCRFCQDVSSRAVPPAIPPRRQRSADASVGLSICMVAGCLEPAARSHDSSFRIFIGLHVMSELS